jgi:hypothetical protein
VSSVFWNKKKKNDDYIITTKITKTSSQAQFEKEIEKQIWLKANTCPACGNEDKESSGIPLQDFNSKIYFIHSECTKCNTEWETRYKEYSN